MKKLAFFGGSFDPVHNGHVKIALGLIEMFALDEFFFVPAHQAPHKTTEATTPAFHRYAMLAIETNGFPQLKISPIELDMPSKPYTVQTLSRLCEMLPMEKLFFVMGGDSWRDIRTWKDWEMVLTLTNHIVVTRPGIEIPLDHVPTAIRSRIMDIRGRTSQIDTGNGKKDHVIYITDAIQADVSATAIRDSIKAGRGEWKQAVSNEVAKYIEKYELYR